VRSSTASRSPSLSRGSTSPPTEPTPTQSARCSRPTGSWSCAASLTVRRSGRKTSWGSSWPPLRASASTSPASAIITVDGDRATAQCTLLLFTRARRRGLGGSSPAATATSSRAPLTAGASSAAWPMSTSPTRRGSHSPPQPPHEGCQEKQGRGVAADLPRRRPMPCPAPLPVALDVREGGAALSRSGAGRARSGRRRRAPFHATPARFSIGGRRARAARCAALACSRLRRRSASRDRTR
jgi:hypothetical protein